MLASTHKMHTNPIEGIRIQNRSVIDNEHLSGLAVAKPSHKLPCPGLIQVFPVDRRARIVYTMVEAVL